LTGAAEPPGRQRIAVEKALDATLDGSRLAEQILKRRVRAMTRAVMTGTRLDPALA
jgi:hypothetical protein